MSIINGFNAVPNNVAGAIDKYNKVKPELVPETEPSLRTDNLFANMVQDELWGRCSNRIVEVIADDYNSSTYPASKMFESDTSTSYRTGSNPAHFINFNFKYPVKINKMRQNWSCGVAVNFKIKGSINGKDYIYLYQEEKTASSTATLQDLQLQNTDYYKYYIIEITTASTAFTYVIYNLDVIEWEGAYYNYTANINIPFSSYEENKILNLELEKNKVDSQAYNIINFTENIIPTISSSSSRGYSEGIEWYAYSSGYSGSKNPTYACDRNGTTYYEGGYGSDTGYFNLKLSSSSLCKAYVCPKKVRIITSGAKATSLKGTTVNGVTHTLATIPQTSNNTPTTFELTCDTNDYYTSFQIAITPTSSTGGWKGQLRTFEIVEGNIKKGIMEDKYINSYDELKIKINNLPTKNVASKINSTTKYTLTYNGSLWEVNRTFVTGSYTGDGATSQNIDIGFRPKTVIVFDQTGRIYAKLSVYATWYGAIANDDGTGATISYSDVLKINDNGFQVYYYTNSSNDNEISLNGNGNVRNYIAFK